VVVRTGNLTPDRRDRLDAHWRLSRPTASRGEHLELRDARLRAALLAGSDARAIGVVPMVLWPGSWNRLTVPRLSTVVETNDREIDLSTASKVLWSVLTRGRPQ
jgi:hypothetical protein